MDVIPFPRKSNPCCNADSPGPAGSISLPVAPRANSRIRFAPTGEQQQAMLPAEAIAWLDELLGRGIAVDMADIDGPGDPLAVPGPTMETISLLGRNHPGITLSITTLGIGGGQYVELLAEKGVRQVTLLVDSIDPETAKLLYAWIRPGRKTVPLAEGVEILISEQARAVVAFTWAGLAVRVRTTVYPGYNHDHVAKIAQRMAALGAKGMTLVPYRPAGGEHTLLEAPGEELMATLRDQAAKYIEIKADPERLGPEKGPALCAADCGRKATTLPKPSKERPNVAVVSSNGIEIDLHLGHAIRVLIYGPREDGLACLLETRPAPEPGKGSSRWEELADTLDDCFVLLAASAGKSPREILSRRSIAVLIVEENIEGTVDLLYGGGRKKKKA
ncbi:MAG: hypothetical protein L3J03_03955 [Desulfobacterales bacterium]|nr:hypothetical protein [Desulfobacterales bacterium]